MKPKATLLPFLALAGCSLLAVSSASAQATYYWDTNDSASGFGTAGGTWSATTTGTATYGWSTSNTGVNTVNGNSVTTATNDSINLGTNSGGFGLASGTIAVSGTVNSGNITVGTQSGTIVLSGGTINFAPAVTFTMAGSTPILEISSLITGAATSITKTGSNTTLRFLNTNNSYTGLTNITGGLDVASLANGGSNSSIGASSNAAGNLVINGSLNYVGTTNASTDRLFTGSGSINNNGSGTLTFTSTGTVAGLTLGGGNAGVNTFNPRITSGGFTKSGAGTWVLANNSNSYTGTTNIQNGTLIIGSIANYGTDSAIGKGTAGTAIFFGSTAGTGTLVYTGGAQDTDRFIRVGVSSSTNTNGATILNNGNGALNFKGAIFNENFNSGGSATRTITLGGTNGGAITGTIQNGTNVIALTKIGSGTWALAGNNTYTGSTTLNAGTLKLDYSTNDTSKLSNTATIGTLGLNGGTLELYGGSHAETVLSTTLNNGTTFIKRTNAPSPAAASTSTLSMGGINFSGGAIDFAADSIATTTTGVTNGILSQRATVAGANFAMKSGSDIVAYDYATAGVTGYTGAAMSANTNYQLTASGASTLAATTGATSNTLKIANTSAGSLAVGTSTLTVGAILFAGSADYDMTTSGAGKVTPSILHNYGTGGAKLNLGALGGALTQYGTGKTVLTGNNAADVGINIFGGTVQFSNNLQIGTNGTVKAIALNNGTLVADTTGGNIALNSSGSLSRTVSLGAGGGTLDVIGGNKLTVSGVISDTAGQFPTLTIGSASSNGTIEFTAANTYTGATRITGGKLYVNNTNGSGTGTGDVTVANGGTLGGSGIITGNVTTQSGGTLAAGTSIESLATGALSLEAGATLAYEANNNVGANIAGDLTAVSGNLTLDLANSAILTLTELGTGSWAANEKLTLISYSGTWNGGLLKYLGNAIADDSSIVFSGYNWTFDYNDTAAGTNFTTDLTGSNFVTMTAVSAVPEPRAALLGGLGLLMLLRRRRG